MKRSKIRSRDSGVYWSVVGDGEYRGGVCGGECDAYWLWAWRRVVQQVGDERPKLGLIAGHDDRAGDVGVHGLASSGVWSGNR